MASEAKFTPGPWKHNGTVAVHCDGLFIATTKRPNGMMKVPSADEQVANAALIAAAPELYEALKGVLFAQQHLLGQFENDDLAAVEIARAALAKASTS